jgi:hypothetical protein
MVFKHFKILVIVLLAVLPLQIYAQWSTDPYNSLIVGYGLLPELCSDSAGGCYITYEQGTTYPRHLILERLNRHGYKPWGTGKRILGEYSEQSGAKIVEDGQNGVIIAYLDEEETGMYNLITRLRVQRIDSSGNFLWGANGVRVSLSETNQYDEEIVTDGNKGCIISWVDTNGSLLINRIDSIGTRLWGDSGKYVWHSPQRSPLIYDRENGCFIVYGIGRLQNFDEYGNMFWPSSGINVPMGANQIKVDSLRNVYLFGSLFAGVDSGIYKWTKNVQKISSNGQILWDSLGIVIDTEKTNSPSPNYSMVVKPDGFAYLAWGNNSINKSANYIQNVLPDGKLQYHEKRSVGKRISEKIGIQIIKSDDDDAIYSWMDYRNGYWNLWAQKIDTIGNIKWDTNDVPITLNGFSDYRVIGDGANGLIALWFAQGDFSIHCQQLSKNGTLGEIITNVNTNNNISYIREFILYHNYPNPFNPVTDIRYQISEISNVSLKIFDVLGREVSTLVNELKQPGEYTVRWNAEDVPSGVYFYRLQTDKYNNMKKMLLLR